MTDILSCRYKCGGSLIQANCEFGLSIVGESLKDGATRCGRLYTLEKIQK